MEIALQLELFPQAMGNHPKGQTSVTFQTTLAAKGHVGVGAACIVGVFWDVPEYPGQQKGPDKWACSPLPWSPISADPIFTQRQAPFPAEQSSPLPSISLTHRQSSGNRKLCCRGWDPWIHKKEGTFYRGSPTLKMSHLLPSGAL